MKKSMNTHLYKTEKVVRSLASDYREQWGVWYQQRHSTYELNNGETLKIGPFEDVQTARTCRHTLIYSGSSVYFCKKNKCKFLSIVEKTKDKNEWFVFVQKICKSSKAENAT